MMYTWQQLLLYWMIGIAILLAIYLIPRFIYLTAKLWAYGKLMGRDAYRKHKNQD